MGRVRVRVRVRVRARARARARVRARCHLLRISRVDLLQRVHDELGEPRVALRPRVAAVLHEATKRVGPSAERGPDGAAQVHHRSGQLASDGLERAHLDPWVCARARACA